jgi:ribosomal protein S18 acetylase RimI-like enzyme
MEKQTYRKTVRCAKEGDLNGIVSLHSKTVKYMRLLCPPGFGKAMQAPVKRKEELSFFGEALEDGESILLVCEAGGVFAGFALATIETFKDDLIEAPFLTVVFIETEPKFRRQGVARFLLARLERIAKRKGLQALELAVWMNNSSAIGLYEKLGFQPLEMRMAKPLA